MLCFRFADRCPLPGHMTSRLATLSVERVGSQRHVQEPEMTQEEAVLAQIDRGLHLILLDSLLQLGSVPPFDEIASRLDIPAGELRDRLTRLVQSDYLALNEEGKPTCLYPFSLIPTTHVIEFNGTPRYAMCAIDALGVSRMLDRPIEISDVCAVCSAPIRLNVAPEQILKATPSESVVVARRS